MKQAPSDFFLASHQPGLFRSSAWLTAWKETWGTHPATRPSGDAVLLPSGTTLEEMIVRTRTYKGKILPVINAFPLGLSTREMPSIRSEYFFFANEDEHLPKIITRYLDNALQYSWDQFYIADVLRSSPTYHLLLQTARARQLDVIHSEIEPTYAIDLRQQDFATYLGNLGKHTRLRLFNRRQHLKKQGPVKIQNIWPDRTAFFQLLNDFHQRRWGKACYRGRNIDFINLFLDHLMLQGYEVDFSVMSVSDTPVSVVFDIRYQGRQYNFQCGYLENFCKSVALGTLHFGYQIETAFNNPAIQFYDFMAGKGKNSDYKRKLVNRSDEFATLLLVRSNWLKQIYKLQSLVGKT